MVKPILSLWELNQVTDTNQGHNKTEPFIIQFNNYQLLRFAKVQENSYNFIFYTN